LVYFIQGSRAVVAAACSNYNSLKLQSKAHNFCLMSFASCAELNRACIIFRSKLMRSVSSVKQLGPENLFGSKRKLL